MGLFDQMMGGFLNNMLGQLNGGNAGALLGTLLNSPMAQAVPGMLDQALAKTPFGSIDGVLAQLRESGLADQVASWIGTGPNAAVSAEQITAALGSDQLAQVAGALGLSPDLLPGLLAEHLPGIIDRLSPDGILSIPGR
ncbi:YidB family protein [Xanthobacter sp. V3C-3]|uniref:YidB family protein n=1 Tax=Xanthobacter lutulentifluminis TaxID=3119935 RepID=UPI003727F31C